MAPERLALLLTLALPGLAGAAVMVALWGPLDLLKLAAALATAPYLLGAYELYKGFSIRQTQRAAMALLPGVLEAADRLIPSLLAGGMNGAALHAAVRQQLAQITGADWSEAERNSVIEEVIAEAWRRFSPETLLDHAAHARQVGAGAVHSEQTPDSGVSQD
jgi:hypothetical protein